MFTEIFLYELKYRLKRPATYIYWAILFALSILIMVAISGGFGGGVSGGSEKVFSNAPFQLNFITYSLSLFAILIVSAIMGNGIYRDYEHNVHALFFTKPLSKFSYLGGRFLGSYFITLLVLTGIGVGLWVGTLMPWLEPEYFGSNKLIYYLQPYYLYILSNTFICGSIFFTLGTLTRNIVSTYIASISILVLYLISGSLMKDLDNQALASILDVFGVRAARLETKYWTVDQKNFSLIPLSFNYLLNRAVWLSVGLATIGLCYKKFNFAFSKDTKSIKKSDERIETVIKVEKIISIPKVTPSFSSMARLKTFLSLAKIEVLNIFKNVYFLAIVFAGFAFMLAIGYQEGSMFGTTTYPVTYQILTVTAGTFGLFFLIIITFYSGEMVWRERSLKLNQLYGAMPVNNTVFLKSKFLALNLVVVALLVLVMFTGLLVQTLKGYHNYELSLYIIDLFGFRLINYIILVAFAFFVQIMVNHKYVGHFIMVVYYLAYTFLPELGMEHKLLNFGSDTGFTYSDMNGFGHFVMPYFMFKLYWGAMALLMAIVSNLFWIRGTESYFALRLKEAKKRFNKPAFASIAIGLIVFIGSGGFIFYNTNVLNDYVTSKEMEQFRVDYEKTYSKYKNTQQPKITDINLVVDIYPKERKADIKGVYILKNKSTHNIDSIHIGYVSEIQLNLIKFDQEFNLVLEDKKLGYNIYKLERTLLPGDSMKMNFEVIKVNKGFSNSGNGDNGIVYNGSFFNSGYLPRIGYNEGGEISSDRTRKKYELQPKPSMPSINDSLALQKIGIGSSADWINFEVILSTVPEQIALAPGYLQKEWVENDRRYFHYKMDNKILNFFAFISAKYEVAKDEWISPIDGEKVDLSVYFYATHDYNVERMIKGMKETLTYGTLKFSPYQFKQLRIIEFPRYAQFAQSFPNTIPYSESIGFIVKVDPDKPDDIDYPFYITTHEVAHQWWGHQVIGAPVQGGMFLMESMAQYTSYMVMEKEYGADKMRKFLKYEMDKYLGGRGSEQKRENPLAFVEGQQYIRYQKGGIVMYALKDYIGEDSVNAAIQSYIKKTAFQEAPYTTSVELIDHFEAVTPDSLKYIIDDMFYKITLYENKASESFYKEIEGGYEVTLTLNAQKFYADSLGKETEAEMHDWIDVGVFKSNSSNKFGDTFANDEDMEPLYLKKHKITTGEQTITIKVSEKPFKAGIDPYCKLIDRHPDDNLAKVMLKEVL